MIFRILKKDLKNKLAVNIILFLFMLLATVFVSSSVNNIMVIMNATDYCMEMGKVADVYVSAYETEGQRTIESWLNGDGGRLINGFSKNEAIILSTANIKSFNGKDGEDFEIKNTIMLQPQWKNNMVAYDMNKNLLSINDGEIALQQKEMDQNNLKVGDSIELKIGDVTKTFKIKTSIMDPAFGGDFVGMTRYFISDNDFAAFKDGGATINYNYNIEAEDGTAFIKALTKEAFPIIVSIQKNMFAFSYVMSLITASMLIIVGVCLIVIAFLILRFTIVFTFEEDYKEIGIMKAIGIKNLKIKNLYLVKYMALIGVASLLGCFISIPISNTMLESVGKNMMMESASSNFIVNVICCACVAGIVLALCYLCTRRIRRYTAIQAIRGGQTGERFRKHSILKLHNTKRLSCSLFLAVNDVLSNISRYVVLILIFMIGIILIILPINTLTTMQSSEMVKNFCMSPDADFYIGNTLSSSEDVAKSYTMDTIKENMINIKQEFKDNGMDIDLETLAFYSLPISAGSDDNMLQLMVIVPVDSDGRFIEMYEGSTPILKNEIAMSDKAMKGLGVKVGDKVQVNIAGKKADYIISGAYSNYMQMGTSAFLNAKVDMKGMMPSGNWMYQCRFNGNAPDGNYLDNIRNTFKDYTFYDQQGAMASQLGDLTSRIGGLKIMIVLLICGVNVLITTLMIRIFIMSEKSQIAMLRSIGFTSGKIRSWQMYRISIVLIFGVILGIICSTFLNGIALKPIFSMMGATHIKIVINPMEVYVLYPVILLGVISVAAYMASGIVKKFDLMEINNAD